MPRLDPVATGSTYSVRGWRIRSRVYLLHIVFCRTGVPDPAKPAHESFQVFFAACAALLVKYYAIYAKHSGIPEIKTVLGGFVMRRFMGPWTLVIKSLGLVRAPLAAC